MNSETVSVSAACQSSYNSSYRSFTETDTTYDNRVFREGDNSLSNGFLVEEVDDQQAVRNEGVLLTTP